ncbi:ABC transporter ATP-binding protein, partial [[Ruminococcus] torques]|nr:ABC transporter ATP-binding protein [[Ruminococcus] torques]
RLRLFFALLSEVISTSFMVLAPFLVGKVTTKLFASIADKVFYWETIFWLLAALVALYFVSQLFSFLQGFGMAK